MYVWVQTFARRIGDLIRRELAAATSETTTAS
jgi:hypothetical protein